MDANFLKKHLIMTDHEQSPIIPAEPGLHRLNGLNVQGVGRLIEDQQRRRMSAAEDTGQPGPQLIRLEDSQLTGKQSSVCLRSRCFGMECKDGLAMKAFLIYRTEKPDEIKEVVVSNCRQHSVNAQHLRSRPRPIDC